ncbi:F-box protein SKIP8-like [Zingiber officinale]|uniref:F-box protein SKIP8-like n=1 Tax=Zingiber officinale TaxID=94328 RepID=UPI001C4D55C0|nr:F-box protein SKIP8-like [Zingiber officinale]
MDAVDPFSLRSCLIAAGATALCCLCAAWVLRLRTGWREKQQQQQQPLCGCGGSGGEQHMEVGEKVAEAEDRQAGGSMIEQLVPEITIHSLSYLDYASLCRFSMTNSVMRKAANDDGTWKVLYHKDFNVEQEIVTPTNGWKAYYAVTKAIMDVNARFFNIIREGSLQAMSCLWLNANYVKCIHEPGGIFTGYDAVMDRWALIFGWRIPGDEPGDEQGIDVQIKNVSTTRILEDEAWVTMDAYMDGIFGSFRVTNGYEFHNGQWFIVHHSSFIIRDQ